MGKIINTFKHGDSRTKSVLGIMIAGIVVGLGILVFSIAVQLTALSFISVVLLILDISYIASTDFSKQGINKPQKTQKTKQPKAKKAGINEPGALEWVASEKDKSPKNKDDKKDSESTTTDKEEKATDSKDKNRFKKDDFSYLDEIDEKHYKKIMVTYKVKQEHVLILVDRCKNENIYETPAFLWKDKKYAYILLLEKEPRTIKYALGDFYKLKIKASVISSPANEYTFLKNDTYISRLYTPLVPNYRMNEDPVSRKKVYKKTLYGIGPDIYCTSGSVKNIMRVLSLEIELTDSKINSGNYGDYFKRVYASRLLYNDKVYSGQEYKENVMNILQEMAETAPQNIFNDNLIQLQAGGLIPQEYADFAVSKRK